MDFAAVQKMAFAIIGGLGIFLLGMKYMSEGLQTVAGPSLKRLIAAVTANRFMATGIGVLVTTIVQSSSVTTVMAVGFVNSGIMGLGQAVGVILGANIGTTITGWIIALKVGKWGLPILGVAAFFFLFSKKEKVKYTALAILGIGMVFFGLEVMKGGVKVIKTIPEFKEAFTYFTADSYFGVLQCAFIGCLLTIAVQSSSATLGITIALASQGVIEFETAAALVLGENIGTTITAWLASIGTTTNAKRAAYFHMTFNLIGVLWITTLFQAYIPFIEWINASFFGVTDIKELVIVNGDKTYPNTEFAIASVHTIFNVVNVLLFLPLTKVAADLLVKFVPDRQAVSKYLTTLEFDKFDSTIAALEYSNSEVNKMAQLNLKLIDDMGYVFNQDPKSEQKLAAVVDTEQVFDEIQKEISHYISNILSEQLSEDEVDFANQQFRLVDEYESISDFCLRIAKLFRKIENNNKSLETNQVEALRQLHQSLQSLLSEIEDSKVDYATVKAHAKEFDSQIFQMRSKHWNNASKKKVDPMLATIYADILNVYRTLKDHIVHVAESRNKITSED
jgi:phosphate:Na+ symporter